MNHRIAAPRLAACGALALTIGLTACAASEPFAEESLIERAAQVSPPPQMDLTPPTLPSAPVDPIETDTPRPPAGLPRDGGVEFSDVFGDPSGSFVGQSPTTEPPTSEPPTTEPPTTEPPTTEPPTTEPPTTEPPTTEPPITAPPTTAPPVAGSPVAALAPSFDGFIADVAQANGALAGSTEVDIVDLELASQPFIDGPTLTDDGTIRVSDDAIASGFFGVTTDAGGATTGFIIVGNPGGEDFVSASVTTFALYEEDVQGLSAAYGSAFDNPDTAVVFAASDGGHWVIDVAETFVSVAKIQDGDGVAAESKSSVLLLDAVLLLPPVEGG